MFQGFYTGISGIQTHQYGLDVVSDNLSNSSTTAFKATTAEFADLFGTVLSNGGTSLPTTNDIGLGTKVQATIFQMQQGSLMPSDRFNDLAIEGNGWFGVTTNKDNYYTRDGHFLFDTYQQSAGDENSSVARLVTSDGKYVLGSMLNNFAYDAGFDYGDQDLNGASGAYVISTPESDVPLTTPAGQGKIEFPTRLAYPVEPTTQVQFFGNLGRENEVRNISADVVSGNNEINRLKLTFTQDIITNPDGTTQPWDGLTWNVTATVTSNDGSTIYDTQNGQAIFSDSGGLSSFTIPTVNNDGSIVSLDLGSNYSGVISSDGIGISGSSQSDGISGGVLTKYGVNLNGIIVADFSNGRQSAIGRVAVYHFQNEQGLNRNGGTYYQQSTDSGDPLFWTDADGNAITGAIVRSNTLEASNVRLDVGLTDMIIMQRAYQANAKTITTVDEMIQKALSMHR